MELTEGAYDLAQSILKHFQKHKHDHKCHHDHHEKIEPLEAKKEIPESVQEPKEKYSIDYSKW
jgi:hypothetical protein